MPIVIAGEERPPRLRRLRRALLILVVALPPLVVASSAFHPIEIDEQHGFYLGRLDGVQNRRWFLDTLDSKKPWILLLFPPDGVSYHYTGVNGYGTSTHQLVFSFRDRAWEAAIW